MPEAPSLSQSSQLKSFYLDCRKYVEEKRPEKLYKLGFFLYEFLN